MRSSAPERSARAVAFRVLARVDLDRAYASMALDAEIGRAGLDPRDARLATAIVYGTLRELDAVDAAIAPRLARGGKLDPLARAALRGSVLQLARLGRQPAHAIVDEAVTWVRRERGPKVAGFVNAVLRRIAAEPPSFASSATLEPTIAAALRDSLGESRAASFDFAATVPTIDLRVRRADAREAIVARLRGARPDATVLPTALSPLGIATHRVGDPRTLPGFEEGDFVVQEQGSQLIGLLVGAKPGERVLDVCAGRGGKTTLLGELVGEGGSIVATDLHEHRLIQIEGSFTRLGLRAGLETFALDWTVGDGGLAADFDRVLVDAPCSGLGTLQRRPELAARISPDAIATLATTQRAILERAARCVKVGGTLLFAVCSPLDAESRVVVEGAQSFGLRAAPFTESEAFGLAPESDGSLALGPFLGPVGRGTDGYRIYRFQCIDRGGSPS